MNLSNSLYVFNHIISNGTQRQGKFYFKELCAWHDYDGYSCYIGYKDLVMSLYFHSRFSYDYEEKATYQSFISLVDKLFTEIKAS